jgi:uncharacterized protein
LDSFLKPAPGGAYLTVKVAPGSARDAFGGLVSLRDGKGEALAAALLAPPVDGKANKALIAFLAKTLGIKKSAITIKNGETSRLKRLELDGEPAVLQAKLKSLIARE